ncbi:MAG: hypothetical protein NZ519_07695 [Bacteroidia bacterium]|nr:hypothetical protein [Bacteroidia bacterium]
MLVYYFNPALVSRDGKVFFEDIVSNTMDYETFFNNFQQHQDRDGVTYDPEAERLWEAGIVQVDNYSQLRFFKETDPFIQKLLKEYQTASLEDKSHVYFKLADVGLDKETALVDELTKLRAELAALKGGRKQE